MEDVSNKTLAVLVSLAIVVSLAGLVGTLGTNQRITGAAVSNVTSGSGTTSLAVSSNLVLTLVDSAINFGNIGVGESNTSDKANDFFNLSNDGSTAFDVYAYGATMADSPFTSTTGGANLLPNRYYNVYAKDAASGTPYTVHKNVNASVGNKTLLVDALGFENGADFARLGINITVPLDESAGSKSAALTVYVEAN